MGIGYKRMVVQEAICHCCGIRHVVMKGKFVTHWKRNRICRGSGEVPVNPIFEHESTFVVAEEE